MMSIYQIFLVSNFFRQTEIECSLCTFAGSVIRSCIFATSKKLQEMDLFRHHLFTP